MMFGISRCALLVFLGICMMMESLLADDDDPSQRKLPLPQQQMPDLNGQMELLKQLRSRMESLRQKATPGGIVEPKLDTESAENPTIDSNQLSQLHQALKSLQAQLPPGIVPPNLNSVPPERIKEAMENPAVQQQMRDLLKQFSRDGVLPPSGVDGQVNPSMPGMPPIGSSKDSTRQSEDDAIRDDSLPSQPNREGRNDRQKSVSDNVDSPPQLPASSINSLRDFFKGLEGNLQKPPSGDLPSAAPKSNDESAESGTRSVNPPGANSLKDGSTTNDRPSTPSPRSQPLRKRDRPSTSSNPEIRKDNSRSLLPQPAEPKLDGSKSGLNKPPEPTQENSLSLQPESEFPGRQAGPPDPSRSSNSGSSGSPNEPITREDPKSSPEGISPDSFNWPAPESALQGASKDQAETLNKLQGLLQVMAKQQQRESELQNNGQDSGGLPQNPAPIGNDRRASPSSSPGMDDATMKRQLPNSPIRNNSIPQMPRSDMGASGRKGDSSATSPSVQEFLKEQLKNFKLPQNGSPTDKPSSKNPLADAMKGSSPRNSTNSNSASSENLAQKAESIMKSLSPKAQSDAQKSSPPIDVAKELERRGFGATLKQIVEKAKLESRKPVQSESAAATHDAQNGSVAGPSKNSGSTSNDLTTRMFDRLKDDLVEMAKDAKFRDASEPSQPQTPQSKSRLGSAMDSVRDIASEIMPSPTPGDSAPTSAGAASESLSDSASPLLNAQFDFTPALILAGILSSVALLFLAAKFLRQRSVAILATSSSVPPLQPSDVQSRADVIRAFHEFALRSTKSVQAWWTHREVERVIATSAPEKRTAMETLADAYELARYLPEEVELSNEDIQSARTALQQCAAS